MNHKQQFSLLQLLAVMTAIAFAIGIPVAFMSNSDVVVVAQLLLCLSVIGAAVGKAFGRMGVGAIIGACLWELGLLVALILRG